MTNDAKQSEEVQHLYRRDGTPSGVFLARQSAPHQSPAEQELPASSVSAASVSPSQGGLGSEASDVQQPAPAAGPSAVEEVRDFYGNRVIEISAKDVSDFANQAEEMSGRHAEALDRLRAENERLKNELETERMRLAGCSSAALGYHKEGDSIHEDYKSASLDDVMRLYKKYERAEAALVKGVVVPEEPTPAMLDAACRVIFPNGETQWPGIHDAARRYYKAMLAAAKEGR